MGLKIDFIADKSLCSNVGLVRKANEDSCGFAQTLNGNLFVVCDGMGGHVGGATASKIGVNSIIEYLSKEKYPDIRQALNDALLFANIQILGTAKEKPELKGMGTTACILLVAGNEAWTAHAGDSRIYLYVDKEKFLHRITKDHSFVQGLVDSGEILDEEAENHPQKNIILRALGIKEELKPTVCAKPVLPAKNDIFLICSDGLSGMVDDTVMESVFNNKSPLNDTVNELINLALQNGGKDNVTAQLIQITGSPWKTAEINGNEYTPARRISQLWQPPKTPKKKNRLLKIAAAAVLLLLLAAGGMFFMRDRSLKKNREQEISKQINVLTDSITKYEKEIKKLEGENITIKKDIEEKEKEKKQPNKALEDYKKELSDNQKVIKIKLDSIKKWENEKSKIKKADSTTK